MYALTIISTILSALSVALLLFLLLRKKGGDTDSRDFSRIEEKTDSALQLCDYSARALDNLNRITETRLNNIQNRLAEDIRYVAETNAQNLERIRRTVDDKLTTSLDGKLSESYARITERLEKMYESVGEMRGLSSSVADIRRVFSNVKLRGTWGEAQLEGLLSQMLAPDQYAKSVKVNPLSNELVDFAVYLPAKDESVLLPVDSKFPVEEFERLCSASELGDREGVERARKNLERAVKTQAESISKKYVLPPRTTDFAVMYLPSEALYAEVLKMDGITDFLRLKRVTVSGPSNFAALLSTLQTGFRTAAIEKRSGELRMMLDEFRLEFAKFAEALTKTRRKLQEAQDAVEGAEKRTGVIGRKLDSFRAVGESFLPTDEE